MAVQGRLPMWDRYDPRSDDGGRGGSWDRDFGSRGGSTERELSEERDPRDVFTKTRGYAKGCIVAFSGFAA